MLLKASETAKARPTGTTPIVFIQKPHTVAVTGYEYLHKNKRATLAGADAMAGSGACFCTK